MELFDTKKTTPFALRIPIWPGTLKILYKSKNITILFQLSKLKIKKSSEVQ